MVVAVTRFSRAKVKNLPPNTKSGLPNPRPPMPNPAIPMPHFAVVDIAKSRWGPAAGWCTPDRPFLLALHNGAQGGRVALGKVQYQQLPIAPFPGQSVAVVTLAARLEGANQGYGTSILASKATRVEAGEAVAWPEIDRVRVVGRQAPAGCSSRCAWPGRRRLRASRGGGLCRGAG